MLQRGMYAVAVLLLGAALAGAQTSGETQPPPLGIAKPYVPPPAPPPVIATPRIETMPLKQVTFNPDEPPPVPPRETTPTPASLPAQGPLPSQGSLLSVEAVGPASIAPDQPLAYQIIVRNAGSNPLALVRIEDVLPPGAKLRSAEPEATVVSDRLAWNLGNLDPGVERRIKVEIQPGPAGEVTVTPTATFTLAKPCRTRIVRPPFAVTQTVAETAPRGPVTFQINVANYSDQPINNIVLHDTLPLGLVRPDDYERLYKQPPIPGAATAPPPREHDCASFNLGPGETKTISLPTVAVQTGRMTNQVTATAVGGWKADAEASILITETPLTVSLDAPTQALVGQDVDFRLEVTNPSTSPAVNARVRQTLPDGVEFLNASTAGTMDARQRMVYWTLDTLPPGQKQTLTLKLRNKTPGDWIFKTTATTDGAPEATAFQTVHIDGAPALSLEIMRHEASIDLGAESVYEVRVLNLGTLAAPGVQVVATVTPELLVLNAEGPTTMHVQPKQIVFDALPQLPGHSATVYRIHVKGQTAGDGGLTVQMTAEQQTKPQVQQVSTRVLAH